MSPLPTKLLMNREDITTDHRDVPAESSTFLHGDETMLRLPFLCFRVGKAVGASY